MAALKRSLFAGFALVALWTASCGGSPPGSSSSPPPPTPASNVLAVTVSGGPASLPSPAVNTLYTSVTVCVPGSTTQCQTIDNIQVDTGSFGLRVLSSVLTLSLPVARASDGNSLVECTQFVDGYSWGPVASADVQITGETASALPVQVIGSSTFPNVPAACSSTGPEEDSVAQFGANGILGIGVFAQDCGPACVTDASLGFYYSCSSTACNPITAVLASQVPNPVPSFTTDNNGTILELPSVAEAGAASVSGSLIFGIDTESNNASGTQTVITLDPNTGDFTTVFAGSTLSTSFIDSGTNGLFFNDANIPTCASSNFANFDCPATLVSLTATIAGQSGVSTNVSFGIDNAQTLATNNPTFTAFPTLGGTYSSSTTTFDWGLPFYYGRRVATAIQGYTTSAATGPYIAF